MLGHTPPPIHTLKKTEKQNKNNKTDSCIQWHLTLLLSWMIPDCTTFTVASTVSYVVGEGTGFSWAFSFVTQLAICDGIN